MHFDGQVIDVHFDVGLWAARFQAAQGGVYVRLEFVSRSGAPSNNPPASVRSAMDQGATFHMPCLCVAAKREPQQPQ